MRRRRPFAFADLAWFTLFAATAFIASCSGLFEPRTPAENPGVAITPYGTCGYSGECARWSADAQHLYLAWITQTTFPAGSSLPPFVLSVVEPDASTTYHTIGSIPRPLHLVATGNGAVLYLSSVDDSAAHRASIYRVSTSDGSRTAVASGGSAFFVVSEDDRVVAFEPAGASEVSGDSIIVLDQTTGNRQSFAAAVGRIDAITPDGSGVVYRTAGSPPDVMLLHVGTGIVERLRAGGSDRFLTAAFSRGDWRLLYEHAGIGAAAVTYEATPGAASTTTVATGELDRYSWAPDARTLVLGKIVALCGQESCGSGGRIEFSAFTGGVGRSVGSSNSFTWDSKPMEVSPDGRWLVYGPLPYLLRMR